MDLSRRRLIGSVGLAGAAGLAGLTAVSGHTSSFQFETGGQIRTSEPIVTTASSETDQEQYSLLANSQASAKRIAWDQLGERDPVFAELFHGANFQTHFLAVSGLRLPRDRKIGTTESTFEDGTMYQTHELRPVRQPTEERQIHTVVEKWALNDRTPPTAIELETTFRDELIGPKSRPID